MSNLQFFVIVGIALLLLIGGAEVLADVHRPQRKACIEAGHEWSPVKYVCIAKLTK
jgi:hypothetical protein